MPTDTQQALSPAAFRMRAARDRRRLGIACTVLLQVREREVSLLVARGLLAVAARQDRDAVANAIGKVLDVALGDG